MRIGFVPLLDAAPLIAARERGFFADEGLNVSLFRQIGWSNIRDKLTFGHLDAAHALLGMPLSSHLGRDSFCEPLVAVMGLGSGGNAITVRRGLFEMGVTSAADLKRLRQSRPGMGKLMVGHVFSSSMHHYLVRQWLAAGGIDPDKDVTLCVIPPPQMSEHMRGGYLDVFCVGEPWNTVAQRQGAGVRLLATTEILPRHPEKVLAVSMRYAHSVGGVAGSTITALVRAVLRGCQWCASVIAGGNRAAVAQMLARPEYLALPQEVLLESLAAESKADRGAPAALGRSPEASATGPAEGAGTFPNQMHAVWMLREMIRWGHLHAAADVLEIAQRSSDATAYRQATAALGLACPAEDIAPMELGGGKRLRPADIAAAPPRASEPAAKTERRVPTRVA